MIMRALNFLTALALLGAASAEEPTTRGLPGHTGEVDCVAFSGDGKLLASAGVDGTVRLWDAQWGRSKQVLNASDQAILSIAFNADGSLLASAGKDDSVIIWNVASGKRVTRLADPGGEVAGVAFSPDGRELLTACMDGTLKGFDTTNWAQTRVVRLSDPACSVAWSPDGKFYAAGDGAGVARVYEVTSTRRSVKCTGHSDEVRSVAFSKSGKYFLTTSIDGSIRLWDPASGKRLQSVHGGAQRPFNAAFNADETTFAAPLKDDSIGVWEISSGDRVQEYKEHHGAVTCVAFSPDGGRMASGGADKMVVLYSFGRGFRRPDQPAPDLKDLAKKQIDDLSRALKAFQADYGFYPHSVNRGMVNALSLKRGGYYRFDKAELNDKGEAIDPWGHPLHYFSPGRGGSAFDLFSWGPDERDECGAGDDIGNW